MSIVTLNDRGVRSVSNFGSLNTGSMIFIKKLTASSSATLSFVNGSSDVVLDSTYREYVFTFKDIHPGTDDADTLMLGSVDGGSNYNAEATSSFFQSFHEEDDSGADLGYLTSKDVQSGTGGVPIDHSDMLVGGYFNTTSAINAIQFKKNTGNIDSGDICLYGIL